MLAHRWKRVILNLSRLVRLYEPQRYGGVVTVFKQELNPIFSSRDSADGWRHLAGGGIIVINTKGRKHVEMIEPPEAETTARKIRGLIDWHEGQDRQKRQARQTPNYGIVRPPPSERFRLES